MAETLTIRTASSTEVVKIAVPGPQGPKGDKGDPGDVAGLPLTTLGDTLYRGASENQRLPIGTSGQILKVSAGGIPEWGAAPATGVTSVALASSDLTITGSPITSSGTITANIAANAVTLEKLQTISSEHLLGRHGSGNGGVQQIGLGTGLAMSGSNIQCTVIAPTASSATPQALGTAAAGTSSNFARADHVHAMPSAADVGAAAATHAVSHAAGTKAQYNDQVAGMTEKVIIRANNTGTAGNSIALNFDGVDDIDTVLAAWNAANTSNQATVIFGDGSQVPDNGEEITLSGGVAGGSDPFKNINQDLGTQDKPAFDGLVVGPEVGGYVTQTPVHRAQIVAIGNQTPLTIIGGNGSVEVYKDTSASKVAAFGFAVPGNAAGDNLVFSDFSGGWSAIFEAPKNAPLDIKTGGVKFADATDKTKKVELSAASVGTGQTRVVTFPNKNITLDDAGDARTPASHTHGNLTNDGKLGSTAGLPVVTTTAGAVTTLALGTANQVLRVNSGATGVEFADPAASGVTGAASSASDVLGVSGANITGVDAGAADRLVFWDDSASKLTYLEAGSGLTISGTVMTASGGASINQAIAVGFVLN